MKKRNLRKEYPQTGKRKSLHADRLHKNAKKPGWRKSKTTGNWYFENRRNRSDKKGKRI